MPRFMTRQGTLHLNLIAIVGGQEVSADQEKDNICLVKVPVDLALPLLPCNDPPVVPACDESLSSEQGQVCLKGVTHGLIPVAVAVE